jgi:putative thioredoxin
MSDHASGRGAIDLASLATPATAGASYVVEVNEANFEATVRQSMRFPVVVEFYSPRAPEQGALSRDLRELANAAGGSWLLARIDVDASPRVAAALQVRAVPTVVGVLSGQLVPLWQGTLARAEAARYIDELLKVAAANGVLGKAQPTGPATPETADEPEVDPRYEAAYAAMEQANWSAALAEFARLLKDNPSDAQAKVGHAQAGLLQRLESDPAPETAPTYADAHPDDLTAILRAADFEVATGATAAGFARLIAGIAGTSGDDRNTLRTRLLELFDTLEPTDPVVLTARRNLATALF